MLRSTAVWSTLLSAGLGASYMAAANGAGIPQPDKQPMSVREGSVRGTGVTGRGHYRTRYFVGGGLHGGK